MSAARRRPVDEKARELAARDLDRSYCVEAGAGTGKTSLLVERFLAIVSSGRAAVEEIAAITFTEKAAGEMKVRLRDGIGKLLENRESPDQERRRLDAARLDLERAPVSTIHAFAASILREHAIEAGIDPGFRQLDALEGGMFLEECWSDFLLDEASTWEEAIRRFVSLGGRVDHLFEMAQAVYTRRGERSCEGLFDPPGPATPDGNGADRRAPSSAAPERFDADRLREDVARIVERLSALARGHCVNADDKGREAIEDLVRRAAPLASLHGEDLERFLFSLSIPKPKGNKGNWNPPDACTEQKGLMKELASLRDEARLRASDEIAAALDDLFDAFLAYAARRKAATGVLDFDDLLIGVRELCKNERALASLRRRYRYVLVDEFQDTDPVQAEIVYLLGADEPGKLFIVGDPKQSIYRFRKADVEIYERFKERLAAEGGERLSIVQNFRSVPGIVEWVNGVFEAVMRAPEDGRYQPRYERIDPWRPGEGPAVVSLDLEMEEESPKTGDIRRREGEAIARLIADLVSSGGTIFDQREKKDVRLEHRHIAVIYPGTTGIESYEDPLRAEGIPYIVEGGKLYYTREEVRSLAAAVWAIEDPYDPLALVGALRSPIFGASDEEIFLFARAGGRLDYLDPGDAISGFPGLAAAFDALRDLHASRNDLGPARTVLALVRRARFLELSLLRPHGDQRVANVAKAVSGARAFEESGGSFRRFARWFRDQETLAAEESESPMVEEDENAVRLLTIHKAKGLQFPVVILANLVQKRRGGIRIAVERGRRVSFKLGSTLQTGDFAALAEANKLRENAETIRLLYVAATRSGDLLVIPRAPKAGGLYDVLAEGLDPETTGVSVERRRISSLPKLEGVSKPFSRFETLTKDERARASSEREEWIEKRARLIESASRAPVSLAPSRLVEHAAAGGAAESTAPPDAALRFGTAFHLAMERIDIAAPSGLDRLCAAAAAEAGAPGAAQELERIVRQVMGSEMVRRASRAKRVLREAPFIVPCEGGFVEGRIDLAFEEAGGWTIVDFKTDDVSPEAVEERVRAYRPQAAAYALAARKAGIEPSGGIVLHFARPNVARTIPVDEALIEEAERSLREASRRGRSPAAG